MKNSKTVFHELVEKITLPEHRDEIRSIAFVLMESMFGLTRAEVMSGKVINVSPEDDSRLANWVERLNIYEPVQYIVKQTDFYRRKFFVDHSVLIPRPETEILVSVVLSGASGTAGKPEKRILDIGTGSGCISITLALEWPGSTVYATDVSAAALEVARKNAAAYSAHVNFLEHDIIRETIPFRNLDAIVSNPPYVTKIESADMAPNVLRYEPHNALFVPDNDPLIFYREILRKSKAALASAGLVAVEINEKFGVEVAALFKENGFTDVRILTDLNGKPRVVCGKNAEGAAAHP
jgi:release factor glutamine methyltransferase